MAQTSATENGSNNAELLRKLYWQDCLTIRQIAQELLLSRREVRRSLAKLGPLRTARKGRIFWSGPFSGDSRERAYLMGLRAGDINVMRTSHLKMVSRVSSTHQAMLELFRQTFAPYGQCNAEPRKVFLSGYDWQLKVQLDGSFEFLVDEPLEIPSEEDLFYWFLAGLADSDGSWCLFGDKGKTACAFMISSQSKLLLERTKTRLEKECYHAKLYLDKKKGTKKTIRGVNESREITLTKDLWRMDIHRREEVRALARKLLPISRHSEKRRKMFLILDEASEEWGTMGPKVQRLRDEIRNETARTISDAEIEYKAKGTREVNGGRRLER